MAPHLMGNTILLAEQSIDQEPSKTTETSSDNSDSNSKTSTVQQNTVETSTNPSTNEKKPYKVELVWRNIIIFIYLHIAAIYGLYLSFTSVKVVTLIFGEFP